jgi:hypothetical protein
MPGGNEEEQLRGLWLVATELMHQGLAVIDGAHGTGVADLGELMALSGEPLDVVP